MITIVCKMTNISKKLGSIIQKLRKDADISQEELAFKAGVHRTYIGMVERGEKNITIINLEKISKALEIPISEIFKFVEKNEN